MINKILTALAAFFALISTYCLIRLEKNKKKALTKEIEKLEKEREEILKKNEKETETRKNLEPKLVEAIANPDNDAAFDAGLDLLCELSKKGDERNKK